MSAPLPELLAPGTEPSVARASRARGRGRALNLRIWLPAGFLILLFCACFLWPLVYPVPKPTGGSILNAGLPKLRRLVCADLSTRSATMYSPASCTAAGSRSRSGSA